VLEDRVADDSRASQGKVLILSNDRTEPQKEIPLFGFGKLNGAKRKARRRDPSGYSLGSPRAPNGLPPVVKSRICVASLRCSSVKYVEYSPSSRLGPLATAQFHSVRQTVRCSSKPPLPPNGRSWAVCSGDERSGPRPAGRWRSICRRSPSIPQEREVLVVFADFQPKRHGPLLAAIDRLYTTTLSNLRTDPRSITTHCWPADSVWKPRLSRSPSTSRR